MIAEAKKKNFGPREFDWSFMGQITHTRRHTCALAAKDIPYGKFLATPGFSQGASREEYYDVMTRSKLVLCPSGPCTPDSFRFAEALEAGCIPIVDGLTPDRYYPRGYWTYVLGMDLPFPLIYEWSTLPHVIEFWLKHWKANAAACGSWWVHQKAEWVKQLREDLHGG
jgi:hypothetical protein